jgi:hypothetical protein
MNNSLCTTCSRNIVKISYYKCMYPATKTTRSQAQLENYLWIEQIQTEGYHLQKAKMAITIDNICDGYLDRAMRRKPCSPESGYHNLDCGHTVISPGTCAGNCAETGHGTHFICHLCILRIFDWSLDVESCSNDLRSLLVDMGRAQMADAEEEIAEQRACKRYSDVAKPHDWLADFINEHPHAYVEHPVKRRRANTVEGRSVLEEIQHVLRLEAAKSEKTAKTMNLERALLHDD